MDATPEAIVNGETGFLIDPTSVDEIVRAAMQLLENVVLRERMGRVAKAHVNEQFGFEKFRSTLLQHLAELGSDGRVG